MTIKRKITSLSTAVALAAAALAPMATSASAEPWQDSHRGGYSRSDRGGDWDRGRQHGRRDFQRGHDGGGHNFHAYRRHKRHNTGKYIALGIGALMLGIMASEAGRY